jgi:hypothetical protein
MTETQLDNQQSSTESENVSGAVGKAVADLPVVDNSDADKKARPRSYSYAEKMSDPQKAARYDTVDVPGVGEVSIPATIGSTYWAVMKVMYERPNTPVYPNQLCDLVEELMIDRDETAWDIYTGKVETTAYHRAQQKQSRQPIKDWKERVINNAKTLTRIGGVAKYGLRLLERGHILRFEYDAKKRQCFILHTNLECLKAKPAAQDAEPTVG